MPASGMNPMIANTTQLTIFYNGNICIFDGIPAEKVAPRYTEMITETYSSIFHVTAQSKLYLTFSIY